MIIGVRTLLSLGVRVEVGVGFLDRAMERVLSRRRLFACFQDDIRDLRHNGLVRVRVITTF